MLGKFNNEESIAILSSFLKGHALTWYKSHYDVGNAHTRNTLNMILAAIEQQFGSGKLSFIDIESLLDRPQRRD